MPLSPFGFTLKGLIRFSVRKAVKDIHGAMNFDFCPWAQQVRLLAEEANWMGRARTLSLIVAGRLRISAGISRYRRNLGSGDHRERVAVDRYEGNSRVAEVGFRV